METHAVKGLDHFFTPTMPHRPSWKRKAETEPEPESDATVVLEEKNICCGCGSDEVSAVCLGKSHVAPNAGLCEGCAEENGEEEICCKRCAVFFPCPECEYQRVVTCVVCATRVCPCMDGDTWVRDIICNRCADPGEEPVTYPCKNCKTETRLCVRCPVCAKNCCFTCTDSKTGVCTACATTGPKESRTVDEVKCRCCLKMVTKVWAADDVCEDCTTGRGLPIVFDAPVPITE